MKPTIDFYIGAPLEIESEKAFFSALCTGLSAHGEPAVVFANFFTPKSAYQIDFFVATTKRAFHIELKNYTAPVLGGCNGPWQLRMPNGHLHQLDVKNPYRQALDCKYAISDAMRNLATSDDTLPKQPGTKFYEHFDSAVCIFPDLHANSSVISDRKVQVLGWPDLLQALVTGGGAPFWRREHWIKLAVNMGLVPWEVGEREPELIAAQNSVRDYITRFITFHRASLHELVGTPIQQNDTALSAQAATSLLTRNEHIHLIGEPGQGKSHLLRHAAVHAADRRYLPIIVSAGGYRGSLSALLDRSIAFLHPGRAQQLLTAAQKAVTSVVLVVDGLNECPATHLPQLMQDLQALYLRWPMTIATSSQVKVGLPSELHGPTIGFGQLSKDVRRAIVVSHSKVALPPDIDEICEPFNNPFELSLAGQCLEDLAGQPTRARLYDAYVRRHLSFSSNPAGLRLVLRALAEWMGDQLITFLPLQEMWSVAEKVLTDQPDSVTLLNDLFSTKLLHIEQGRVSFQHELMANFFESESLLIHCRTADELITRLKAPRKLRLLEAVIGASTEADVIEATLHVLATPKILADCLRGRHGGLARERTHADAVQLLINARAGIEPADVSLLNEDGMNISVSGGPVWTRHELALMETLGLLVPEGYFVSECLQLIADTEAHCLERLQQDAESRGKAKPRKSQLVSGLWVFGGQSSGDFPASRIVHTCHNHFANPSPAGEEAIINCLQDLASFSLGELYLLCALVRRGSLRLSQWLPILISTCWQTGAYHLRLEALMVAQWHSHDLDDTARSAIRELLETFQTQNIMLSTALVEALHAYDLIDPPVSVEQAKSEIDEILKDAEDPTARRRACGVVSMVFEEIFSQSYMGAIDQLEGSKRLQLYIMAALGSESYSMMNDWILQQLVAFHDRRALPAFLRFTASMDARPFCVQDTVSCYVSAMIGASEFVEMPPTMQDLSSDDRRAWQLYGELFFWLSKPGVTDVESNDRCQSCWKKLREELPFAAVDPLRELVHSSLANFQKEKHPSTILFRRFRNEIRTVLEFGLGQLDRLTSLFDRGFPSFRNDLAGFVIQQLESVGNAGTAALLEKYADTPAYGIRVVQAIRAIRLPAAREDPKPLVDHA
jgi:hypothetical protein